MKSRDFIVFLVSIGVGVIIGILLLKAYYHFLVASRLDDLRDRINIAYLRFRGHTVLDLGDGEYLHTCCPLMKDFD